MTDDSLKARAKLLRERSYSFCMALCDPPPPDRLLSTHFATNSSIIEHGPSWAADRLPFLGRTLHGIEGCLEYFRLLGETLDMASSEFTFPPAACFMVDPEAHTSDRGAENKGVVSVVAHASFRAARTGKTWREQCIYRLSDFDEDGKIGSWEVWADPLSAWEAVGGGDQEGDSSGFLIGGTEQRDRHISRKT